MMIHQLQAAYLADHDRILVRLNTQAGEEIRLWLTRRMLKSLFPHIVKASAAVIAPQAQPASHDGADSQALTEFRKQESLQQTDFSTPFRQQATALPIGDEPLLATTVHITPVENDSLRVGFEEKVVGDAPPRSFEVTLGSTLLHGFLHLLETALKQADWGIALGDTNALNESQPMDPFAAAEPPRYLN